LITSETIAYINRRNTMRHKRLSSYTETEITVIKQQCVKASGFGLLTTQCAMLVGLSLPQLESLLSEDDQFATDFKQAKQEGIKQAAAVMHDLARKGSFQAASFLLQHSPDSPYSEDGSSDPKTGEALQKLLVYLSNEGGLLPPPTRCPHCQQSLNPDNSGFIDTDIQSVN
jgi:hypothetical protein